MGLSFLVIKILNQTMQSNYFGLWLLILSVVGWINIVDGGVSNGLRNKVAFCFANNEFKKIKDSLSSTLFYMLLILLPITIVLISIILSIDLRGVINAVGFLKDEISVLATTILLSAIINVYFLQLSAVAYGIQKPLFDPIKNLIFQILFLIFSVIIKNIDLEESSSILYAVSGGYILATVLSNFISSSVFLLTNRYLVPAFSYVSIDSFRDILVPSGGFLILQLSAIVLFATDSVLVASLFSVDQVSEYNLASKIFFIFIFVQGALIAPFWSKYSSIKENETELRRLLFVSLRICLLVCTAVVGLMFVAEDVMRVWLGDNNYYNREVCLAIMILVLVRLFSSNFSTLLNGLGVFRMQIITSLIAAVLNIPISVFLVKIWGMGVEGVAYGTVFSLVIFALPAPFYVYVVLRKIRTGEHVPSPGRAV
jgi:O-antigen/teichoic acid export membrane protein